MHKGQASYQPNSIDNNWPAEVAPAAQNGGFETYQERVDGHKIRQRSESFSDHFSQARLYYQSLAPHEQKHVVDAYTFELSKVKRLHIREREVKDILANIDFDLAKQVAHNLGIEVTDPKNQKQSKLKMSKKLSLEAFAPADIKAKKIAILVHPQVNATNVDAILKWASAENAIAHILTPTAAPILTLSKKQLSSDGMQKGEPSIAYDAVVIVDGDNFEAVQADGVAKHYLQEAYKHLKPVVFLGDKVKLIEALQLIPDQRTLQAECFNEIKDNLKKMLIKHRVWAREAVAEGIPA